MIKCGLPRNGEFNKNCFITINSNLYSVESTTIHITESTNNLGGLVVLAGKLANLSRNEQPFQLTDFCTGLPAKYLNQ